MSFRSLGPALPALALLSASGWGGEMPPTDRITPVTVYLTEPSNSCPRLIAQMQSEVDRIFLPAGVRLDWRAAERAGANESSCVIVFVKLTGKCDAAAQCPDGVLPVLGWTHMVDGELQPYCQADCNRVRALLYPQIRWQPLPFQQSLVSRALARVVSHELYHALARTAEHSVDGVSKAHLTARDLIGDEAGLAPGAVSAIRSYLGQRLCIGEEGVYRHPPRRSDD